MRTAPKPDRTPCSSISASYPRMFALFGTWKPTPTATAATSTAAVIGLLRRSRQARKRGSPMAIQEHGIAPAPFGRGKSGSRCATRAAHESDRVRDLLPRRVPPAGADPGLAGPPAPGALMYAGH